MGSADGQVQAYLTIRGIVQGVFFRVRLKERADMEGVSGWVRNLADGSVEALLVGSRSAIEEVLAWARVGPLGANVDSVEARWSTPGPGTAADELEIR